jgi:hypothetical protein
MLSQPFKESTERLVELPEVDVLIFEEFLIWIYALNPSIAPDTDMDTLIGLAVFADLYLVYTLKNQLSDVIRAALLENPEKLTPEIIQVVYRGTYTNSTLRRLCSFAFALRSGKVVLSRHENLEIWKSVFTDFADFGWDYFQSLTKYQLAETTPAPFGSPFRVQKASIMAGGSCRFHDHSDILGWKRTDVSKCPYPHGAAVELPDAYEPKSESASTPNGSSGIAYDRGSNEVPYDLEPDETSMTVDEPVADYGEVMMFADDAPVLEYDAVPTHP